MPIQRRGSHTPVRWVVASVVSLLFACICICIRVCVCLEDIWTFEAFACGQLETAGRIDHFLRVLNSLGSRDLERAGPVSTREQRKRREQGDGSWSVVRLVLSQVGCLPVASLTFASFVCWFCFALLCFDGLTAWLSAFASPLASVARSG